MISKALFVQITEVNGQICNFAIAKLRQQKEIKNMAQHRYRYQCLLFLLFFCMVDECQTSEEIDTQLSKKECDDILDSTIEEQTRIRELAKKQGELSPYAGQLSTEFKQNHGVG